MLRLHYLLQYIYSTIQFEIDLRNIRIINLYLSLSYYTQIILYKSSFPSIAYSIYFLAIHYLHNLFILQLFIFHNEQKNNCCFHYLSCNSQFNPVYCAKYNRLWWPSPHKNSRHNKKRRLHQRISLGKAYNICWQLCRHSFTF